jgi:glycosyltransferase involved in cell wall biosynthesis
MPKQLCIVVGTLNLGGCEKHLSYYLPELNKEKFSVTVFTLSEDGELAEEVRSKGVNVIAPWVASKGQKKNILFRVSRLALVGLQFLIYNIKHKPSLVHYFLPGSYLFCYPIAYIAGVRNHIVSRRSLNNYQKGQPAFIIKYERWLHLRMNALLGNSKAVVNQLIDEELTPADKTVLIYNGIKKYPEDIFLKKKSYREKIKISPDTVLICVVANLIPYKGHSDLIKAAALIESKNDWHIICIGEDFTNIKLSLIELGRKQGVEDKISFLGKRDDVSYYLAASDIGVLASYQEGFSNALLESMLAGLPMVVTNVGGNPEAVIDSKTGYVVEPHDENELANKINKLIDNADLRKEFGQLGKETVELKFSLANCVSEYEKIYDLILADSGKQQ